MMWLSAAILFVYCLFIVLASLVGGWLPSLMRLTHTRTQLMMSFVAGLMLGVALLHLLPHAAVELPSLDVALLWMLGGLLTMFFLIRIFQFHQHGQDGQQVHIHGSRYSWAGLAFGLALHTAIDGVALAASVLADARHGAGFPFFGVGVFLAILLHKPLDALSITSLMAARGSSRRKIQFVNAGFALMCPLGAAVFCFSTEHLVERPQPVVGCALAFAAGVFLCISLGDLLPEVHFHSHDRMKLSAALLLGVLLAYAIGFVEPEHTHSGHGHSHHHHSHEAGHPSK